MVVEIESRKKCPLVVSVRRQAADEPPVLVVEPLLERGWKMAARRTTAVLSHPLMPKVLF